LRKAPSCRLGRERKESSFSEEKEPKRLLLFRCFTLGVDPRLLKLLPEIKVFLLLFRKTKEESSFRLAGWPACVTFLLGR
jgi:hypothetical protein